MILIAIILLGVLTPFIIVFGIPLALLAFPIFLWFGKAKPRWDRLPLATRRNIRWRTVWAASCMTWGVLIWGVLHR